jgi:WD40 repeat protein
MKLCLNYMSVFFLILFFSSLGENFAAGLYGGRTVAYTTTQVNFRDQQRATGFVRMTNGFTLATPASGPGSTHGSSLYMDTCLSVSGAIDLRNTNTMILLSDLKLDNGVTLSSSGRIYGYDRAIILTGDLTIPANTVIHIGGRIVIDGRGNNLILGKSAQLFVDAGATLTLRNLFLQNTQNNPGNPPVLCATSGSAACCSTLCLDNVELALVNDFWFSSGQMFINNDVVITGTSALVYRSCQPSFITSGAQLYFDVGTTFSCCPATFTDCPYSTIPTTTTSNFILMADQTSQLCLNGCNFCATITGCRLTIGSVLFDNMVSLNSQAANDIASTPLTLVATAVASGTTVNGVVWSPDDRYILVPSYAGNKFQIFSFNGTSLTDMTGGGIAINSPVYPSWSPDGKFIAVPSQSPFVMNLYSVVAGVPTLISTRALAGSFPISTKWSPDGRLIATACTISPQLQIFSFTGLSAVPICTLSTGVNSWTCSWSPDGKFIASGIFTYSAGAAGFQVYSYTPPSTLTLVKSFAFPAASSVYQTEWSPDGRYIALIRLDPDDLLQVYSLQGNSHIQLVGSVGTGAINPQSFVWSPDGRYLVVCGASVGNIQIYSFSGFGAPTLVGQVALPGGATARDIRISHDGKYVVVGGNSSSTVYVYQINYIRTQSPQALSSSIVFGNAALGSSYDATVRSLSGAQTILNGLLSYDCVN